MFISIEGIDGVGKSTVVRYLVGTRFPDAVLTQQPIPAIKKVFMTRGISSFGEALLAAASMQVEVDLVIKPALNKGLTVISDRFHDSMLAYQGYGRAMSFDLLNGFVPDVLPDLTILLDCDPEIAFRRLAYRASLDRVEDEPLSFHRRVRQGFLNLARVQPNRFVVVDAGGPIEGVLAEINKQLKNVTNL